MSPKVIEVIVEDIKIKKEYFVPNFIIDKHIISEEKVSNVRSAMFIILHNKKRIIVIETKIEPLVILLACIISNKK